MREVIAYLELCNRDAVRLGELVSLATRIEPELLRAARLELTPFDAAAEADLWFSQLVETRTADWITLTPAAARELRSALATNKSRLAAAHALITEAHSGAPVTIILEEEILWLALTTPPGALQAIEERLRLVLGKLLEDPVAHRGLAHWFAGAARRLPDEAQATEAYALLSFVTSGLLDGRRLNAPEPKQLPLDALANVLPDSIPKLRLWATLTDYGLTLRPDKSRGFVPLEVPRTNPLLFEVRPLGEPPQFVTLRRSETKDVRIKSGVVELRTAAGDLYRLRRRPRELSSAGMKGLVMGFGGTGAYVLTALKELAVLKHVHMPETMKFLLFDTIADWRPGQKVQLVGGEAEERLARSEDTSSSLDRYTEYFYLGDYEPVLKRHIYDYLSPAGSPDAYPHLKDWFHAPWFSRNVRESQLNVVTGAAQQRQIGRYAMFKNAEKIVERLRSIIRELSYQTKGADVNIWLVASAAGGTGAGALIDAAYLTRLAAGDSAKLIITGVIVLPSIHMDLSGISQGRAYSLLRELERVQEQGIPESDRYVDLVNSRMVSSRVFYDRNGQQVATARGRLFDNLFYIGRDCSREEQRQQFFTSTATAMEPYFDADSGPMLLQRAVNKYAPASAFGAARVCVPTATFKQMFAWEQVAEYLRRAAAPVERNGHVERLHAGATADREHVGRERLRNLLHLFDQLLVRSEDDNEAFARRALYAEQIITDWYEFSNADFRVSLDDLRAVQLTYVNPFVSLTEPDVSKVPEGEVLLKTYKENARTRGPKESQEQSRDRFADQLEEVMRHYLGPDGGERTFEQGRRQVLETVSERLRKKVDDLFIGELKRGRTEFPQSSDEPSEGTPLTRLFTELTWMLSSRGPLRTIQEVIRQLIAAAAREQPERSGRQRSAIQELRASRRTSLFSFVIWVEQYQQAARDECAAYISWYQKHELLKDMQQLVLIVEGRLREWERLLIQLFDALVRREGRDENKASALFTV
ncbi:MAG: hypothetical protein JO360_08505, partial [Acidobacteria bacterium]|nr:hypothetical protein [Acidobacteriota bacterium]